MCDHAKLLEGIFLCTSTDLSKPIHNILKLYKCSYFLIKELSSISHDYESNIVFGKLMINLKICICVYVCVHIHMYVFWCVSHIHVDVKRET